MENQANQNGIDEGNVESSRHPVAVAQGFSDFTTGIFGALSLPFFVLRRIIMAQVTSIGFLGVHP